MNQRAGEPDARLFEIAKRFIPIEGKDLPQEDSMLALAGADDFETLRGVLEAVFDALRLGGRVRFAATGRYPDLEAGAAAEILLDDRPLGMIGRLARPAAQAFDLDGTPTVAELCFARLVEAAALEPAFQPLPQFPAITRDLAIVVAEAVTWAQVAEAVAAAGAKDLESLEPVSVYRGKPIPAGRKSVALRLVFRSREGTLTHDEADAMQAAVLESLKSSLAAELRA